MTLRCSTICCRDEHDPGGAAHPVEGASPCTPAACPSCDQSACTPALQNDSLATLLARLEGILGEVPQWMIRKGRYSHRYYTRQGLIYERSSSTVSVGGALLWQLTGCLVSCHDAASGLVAAVLPAPLAQEQ